jgi:hypothetical protein
VAALVLFQPFPRLLAAAVLKAYLVAEMAQAVQRVRAEVMAGQLLMEQAARAHRRPSLAPQLFMVVVAERLRVVRAAQAGAVTEGRVT